jgi:predicted transcriptional regulator
MQATDSVRQLEFLLEKGGNRTQDIEKKRVERQRKIRQPGKAIAMKGVRHAEFSFA